jgi:hypothetical protein
VQQDWARPLPAAKAEAFEDSVRELEILYSMFSVSLNETFELRRTGKAELCCEAIFVIPTLCGRLAVRVECLLHTLGDHARHFGIIPNTVPLDANNFRGGREQRTARMSDLLSRVLLTERSQFLHKIDTLEEMVFGIRKQFSEVAADLGNGASIEPSSDWHVLDDAHFDLNTCLREAIVLLKSFMVILPIDQLKAFQKSVETQTSSNYYADPSRSRRMTLIEGQ